MIVRKNLLIIFYRNPELGKVKTRLAATLGDANALAIYLKLVAHTRSVTENLDVDKIVCYSHFIDKEDNWNNSVFDKQLQKGVTLGERLSDALERAFEQSYERVCVIGSDCFELTGEIIDEAFRVLMTHDAVIGPARDGGYYLLGMSRFIPEVFWNKEWSTSSVASDTINDFKKLGIKYKTLRPLTDVDNEADLPDEIRSRIKR